MTTKKKILILDFDHTISNSRKYINDICNELEFDYKSLEDKDAKELFLKEHNNSDVVKNLRKKLPEYRFESVDELLSIMNDIFDHAVLITKSNYYLPWQKGQIKGSDLSRFFDEIVIVESEKHKEIEKFLDPSMHITFVNDVYASTPENELVRTTYPEVKVIDIDNYSDDGFTIGDFYRSLI